MNRASPDRRDPIAGAKAVRKLVLLQDRVIGHDFFKREEVVIQLWSTQKRHRLTLSRSFAPDHTHLLSDDRPTCFVWVYLGKLVRRSPATPCAVYRSHQLRCPGAGPLYAGWQG